MSEFELLEIFRRALRASLAVPLMAGATGCSNASAGVGPSPDAATRDAGHPTKHDAADARHDVMTLADAASDHSSSGPDAAAHDAVATDAPAMLDSGRDGARDAGHDARADARTDDAAPEDAWVSDVRDAEGTGEAAACVPTLMTCFAFVPASCFDGGLSEDASISMAECDERCPGEYSAGCGVVPTDGGMGSLECFSKACANGRAYEGMPKPTVPGQASPLGHYLALAAELEAASIEAFRILEAELSSHDAPASLIASASSARRDEVRHTRVTRRLARRHGRSCPSVHRSSGDAPRPLEAVARENAVEGCVRETYAALVAYHQAEFAADPDVRAAMARIAVDETRHAALAWQVAAWAAGRLDEGANARVATARRSAVDELRRALGSAVPVEVTTEAGVPAARRALRMFEVVNRELWSRERDTTS
jgi:hypothetical protein